MMEISARDGHRISSVAAVRSRTQVWVDGLDGQEDELEDVHKGELDPPTNTEGEGSVDDPNRQRRGLETEDEDDAVVERIERGGYSDEEEELARKAGVRLPN